MHIFFVTQWFPTAEKPYYGIFILEHARAVAREHKVTLLHIEGVRPDTAGAIEIKSQHAEASLDVYHLAYRRPVLPYSAWIREMVGARRVFDECSKIHGTPDIIHANVWNTADVSLILGRLAGTPVVLSEHSSAYGRKLLSAGQTRKMRLVMNRVDLILPVCDALGETIKGYGIHRPMVSVPNVVDPEIFYPATPGEQVTDPEREIALIARLSEEKAVHLAIQAVANLQQQGIFIHLQLAGDGPQEANLRALVEKLGLAKWVHFNGYLTKTELAALLRHASALLLTSQWESQPVVILEALASGLPVIAPRLGGIPEVIRAEHGLLFTPGDISDLTTKLASLLSNLSAYDAQCISQYARDNFSLSAVSSRLSGIYQTVIEKRHANNSKPGV